MQILTALGLVSLECIRKVHTGETCIPPVLVAKLAASMSSEPLTGREGDRLPQMRWFHC